MKLDGNITILFGDDGLNIEVRDTNSGTKFLTVKMNPENVTRAFGRLADTPCDIEVIGLDRVGLYRQNKNFEFPLSDKVYSGNKDLARKEVYKHLPEGWQPDLGFSSQNSFFEKDGEPWARTIIRTWTKEPPELLED